MSEPVQPAQQPVISSGENNTPPYTFAQPDASHRLNGWQGNESPTSGNFNWLFKRVNDWITWLLQFALLSPGAQADTVLTVAANAIAPTQGNHAVDTSGGAATVNTIATGNLNDGRLLVLRGNNPGSNPVTLAHAAGGSGQLHLAGAANMVLSASLILTLKRVGADWYEVSRSQIGDITYTLFSASGTYTPKKATIFWTGQGGGGGGGGGGPALGADSSPTVSTDGGVGGDTWIGVSSNKARGGNGGSRGSILSATQPIPSYFGAPGAALAPIVGAALVQQGSQVGDYGTWDGNLAHAGGYATNSKQNPSFAIIGTAGGPGNSTLAGSATGPGQANTGQAGGAGSGSIVTGAPNQCPSPGGSGCHGEVARGSLAVTPGTPLTITIGAGGTAGAGANGSSSLRGGNGAAGGSGWLLIQD